MAFQKLTWLYVLVPVLVLLIVLHVRRRHYWGHSLVDQLSDEVGTAHPFWRLPKLLETAAIGGLLMALLEPIYPFVLNRVERGGLEILIVLDLSQSMEEAIKRGPGAAPPRADVSAAAVTRIRDLALGPLLATPDSRMEAVKKSALDFVSRRPGDAIGLVVFSNNGYLVTPATFDHESLAQYLVMTGTQALVNEGYTGIGEGLATANRYFEQQRQTSRRRTRGQVIVLFTDGENNTGREPLLEIERARAAGTRVYMIAVELQPGAAQELVDAIPSSGGKYYDAQRTSDLDQALIDINEVEKGVFYTLSLTRNQPAYFFFVVLALACLALRVALHAFPRFVEIS
jgi:Mg-chelatase subunit ChlD